jgi:photosystem II stability/assembly factor-like uncharacterized protein
MKRTLKFTTGLTIIIFVWLMSFNTLSAQWVLQNPYPTMNSLFGTYFINANTGIAVGNGGTILRTTNGGSSWISQTSGTTNGLYSVLFTDANTGTAVGSSGTILHTTNCGDN